MALIKKYVVKDGKTEVIVVKDTTTPKVYPVKAAER